MKGFIHDIEDVAVKNEAFRRVLYTAKNCQLVVMSLKPGEEIGGEAILDGVRTSNRAGLCSPRPGRDKRTSVERGVDLFLRVTSKVLAGNGTNKDQQVPRSPSIGVTVSTHLGVVIGRPRGLS